MSIIHRLASSQKRRDEVPNQELARDLAAQKDADGIREIAENLWSKDKNVRADCIKVLYEIGYLDPALVADYAADFLKLLKSGNNRLVWGGMTALAAIAELRADFIHMHLGEIQKAMGAGSVITVDNGILALARAASQNAACNRDVFPYLLQHLQTCRSKDVAQHAEKSLAAVNAENKTEYIATLEKRIEDLSGSGLARVKKVIKQAGGH